MLKKAISDLKQKNGSLACASGRCYIKLFGTDADRRKSILMSLPLLVTETMGNKEIMIDILTCFSEFKKRKYGHKQLDTTI